MRETAWDFRPGDRKPGTGVERRLHIVRVPVKTICKRILGLGLRSGIVWPCAGHSAADRWRLVATV